MRIAFLTAAAVLLIASRAAAAPVAGVVLDAETMQGVGGATLTVRGTTTTVTAGGDGGFVADLLPGTAIVDVVAEGYVADTYQLEVTDAGQADVVIVLYREGAIGESIVVFDRAPLQKTAPGHTELSRDELVKAPGTRGDALHAVRNLPGVANVEPFTPGEFAFGLVIRGSSPEDSMYLVNGIELPLLYHFFGIQSILPSEMVDDIEYIPGGFDVQYGRSTGGIINIHTRTSHAEEWQGFAELSFINAAGFVEGPLSREHDVRLTAGFRRSMIDAVVPLAVPEDVDLSFTTLPQYYDAQLRIDWSPDEHNDATFMAFTSWDFASGRAAVENPLDPDATGAFENRVGFTRAALSWDFRRRPAEVFARMWLGDGHYLVAQGRGLFQDFDALIVGGRADSTYRIHPAVRLRGGGEFQTFRANTDARFPLLPTEGQPGVPNTTTDPPVELEDFEYGLDSASVYAAADIDLGRRVAITPGVRYDRFISSEAQTVSPRITTRVELAAAWTAMATVGRYTRIPNGFEGFSRQLEPEDAIHYVGGVEYRPAPGVVSTLTAFYTDLDNLVTFDPMLVETTPFEGWINRGAGETYGVETMVRAQRDGWFGWASYTLSRSQRTDGPGLEERLFDFDQMHNLVAAASRQWGAWRFGARFQYTTGEPDTPVVGSIYDADRDVYRPEYGEVNSERKDDAHQLDLRVEREWRFQHWRLAAYLDVTNVYAHERAISYNYSFNYGRREAVTTPPVLPALGVRGSF